MEVLLLIVVVLVVCGIFGSMQRDIKNLQKLVALHNDEHSRIIRQLQDNGLSTADREVLDRLVSAANRSRREQERYSDDA